MALTENATRRRRVTASGPTFKIALAGTVRTGDLIGYSSGWKRALATVGTAIQAKLIALEDGDADETIEVTAAAAIDGFTDGTPGGLVYLEEGAGVGGGYTEVAPSTSGDVNTILGHVISASEIFVDPSVRAGSVA